MYGQKRTNRNAPGAFCLLLMMTATASEGLAGLLELPSQVGQPVACDVSSCLTRVQCQSSPAGPVIYPSRRVGPELSPLDRDSQTKHPSSVGYGNKSFMNCWHVPQNSVCKLEVL